MQKGKKSSIVPINERTQSFIEKGICIDGQARCCENHLNNQHFCEEALNSLKSKYTQTLFKSTDIVNLLENVRKALASSSGVNFKNIFIPYLT